MNIGPLNTRGRIERQTVTQDQTVGTDVPVWTLVGVRWCGLQDVLPSRAERVRDGVEQSSNQTRIRLRYCTDLDTGMRIIVNRPEPQIFRLIAGPAVLGDKDGVEFMAERLSTDG